MSEPGYTLKERIEQLASMIGEQLAALGSQLDGIERKLDEKASKSALEQLVREFREFERDVAGRLYRLELARAGSVAISGWLKWAIGAVVSGGLLTLVYYAIGGHG